MGLQIKNGNGKQRIMKPFIIKSEELILKSQKISPGFLKLMLSLGSIQIKINYTLGYSKDKSLVVDPKD